MLDRNVEPLDDATIGSWRTWRRDRSEQGSVAQGLIDCIEDTAIPASMAGLLYALPNTQLSRRLRSEGRLHENHDVQPSGESDQCTAGINFVPLRPREEILGDYLKVVESIYAPERYFGRVLRVGQRLDSPSYIGTHPLPGEDVWDLAHRA